MSLSHEDIKLMLPDLMRDKLPAEMKSIIQSHLKECTECREELSLLHDLGEVGIPEPDAVFWQTLPEVVSSLSRQNKRRMTIVPHWLLRPVPAMAGILLIVLISSLWLYFSMDINTYGYDPSDPFTITLADLSGVHDRDITVALEEEITTHNDLINEIAFNGDFFYQYLSSLTEAEKSYLEEIIKTEMKGG